LLEELLLSGDTNAEIEHFYLSEDEIEFNKSLPLSFQKKIKYI